MKTVVLKGRVTILLTSTSLQIVDFVMTFIHKSRIVQNLHKANGFSSRKSDSTFSRKILVKARGMTQEPGLLLHVKLLRNFIDEF